MLPVDLTDPFPASTDPKQHKLITKQSKKMFFDIFIMEK